MILAYADDLTIKAVVQEQLTLYYARRRGRRRKIEKILGILLPVSWFTRDGFLLTKDQILKYIGDKIKEDDLEDHLHFLSQFPKDKPFLIKERGSPGKGSGGLPYLYKFNFSWLEHTGRGVYLLDTYLV